MKEFNIRDQLIQDIRDLSPDLLIQVYQYLEMLKTDKNYKKRDWKSLVGCLSDEEAKAQEELIDKEFENIEGDW